MRFLTQNGSRIGFAVLLVFIAVVAFNAGQSAREMAASEEVNPHTTLVLHSQDVQVPGPDGPYTMVTQTLCVDGEKVFLADGAPLLLRGPCDGIIDGKWPGR